MGQIDDAGQAVTMDLKQPGNPVYLIGDTAEEFGGSHWTMIHGLATGAPPQVSPVKANPLFTAVHSAMSRGTIRACHDLSEGGLATAAAEMAFAGGWGLLLDLEGVAISQPHQLPKELVAMFSESNSRFLVEVEASQVELFEQTMGGVPLVRLGEVTDDGKLTIRSNGANVVQCPIDTLKQAWKQPLAW